ncbi:unnamed protein product [Didymodactylos carnosus]|uniref:NAD(P)(+)--arginine ADP-ribosyltransferase n=2 Tax=Didymodactylos carnosus TaxID=1234261 RepID=A0A8S2PFL7_9BILA|nr:unnamed protein product [Didymodactylos carnosus]
MTIDDNQLTSYQEAIGKSRCWDGFTSTTKNHEKAQTFGNILFIIDANSNGGIDISALSDYDEEEVLLPPGTTFTIDKVHKTETNTLIYLRLPPSPTAASTLIHLYPTPSTSDEHCCDESAMSSGAIKHLTDG